MIDMAKLEARRVIADLFVNHAYVKSVGVRKCCKHGMTEFYSVGCEESVCGKCHDERKGNVSDFQASPVVDGIPPELARCTFENFKTDTTERRVFCEQAKSFAESPSGRLVVFLGSYGLGKSHLAVACLKRVGGVYLKASEAARQYGGSFPNVKAQLFEQWCAKRLIVIDEIGTGRVKDELPILQDIIARRYDDKQPLLLVSNMSYRDFLDYVGGLIKSRLMERGECIQFTGTDHRTNIAQAGGRGFVSQRVIKTDAIKYSVYLREG